MHCSPNQQPKDVPDFFKMLLGQSMSLWLPPSLVTAFLASDPAPPPESSTTALRIRSGLTVLTPTAVTALLAAHANRAPLPRVAQEGAIARVRDTSYPRKAQSTFVRPAVLPLSPATAFCRTRYLNVKQKALIPVLASGNALCGGQPGWVIWFYLQPRPGRKLQQTVRK